MQEGYGRNLDLASDDASSHPRCANSDLSTSIKFGRSTSFGGINRIGSWRRGFVIDGVPNGEAPQTGDVGDQEASIQRVRSGLRQDSIGALSSRGSSRRSYISLSRNISDQIVDAINLSRNLSERILGAVDSSLIAQAGDNGDRVVADDREEVNANFIDSSIALENGALVFPDDALILSNGIKSSRAISASAITPLAEGIISPLPTDAILHPSEKNQSKVTRSLLIKDKLPWSLDYIYYMIHLAVFGILGVFTRYLLEELFGPAVLALTGDRTPLYLDLPANMLGSFLMGWFGIVFKADIRDILSDHVVVGLTTGYLGSLTTFSGWNQKMLVLSSEGDWVFAVAGIILGTLLVNESIRMGVESAEALHKTLLSKFNLDSPKIRRWRVESRKWQLAIMIVLQLVLISLYVLSGILAKRELDNATNGAFLWVGCLVGPLGVWARWYLARLNGLGIGRKGWLKWLPVGTLLANILAACLMAALTTIRKVVKKTRYGIIISGVEFGFLGCLSTVSTFVAEVYAMRQSGQSGRALMYTAATILISFILATLIYSVPVWTKAY